jgi:DNA-binding MarR family transcriptional regulator
VSTTERELLSATALAVFKLTGQFLALAEELAQPVGLTAAWWQVLGAVVSEPLPVAGIAREMGITRQSVQRITDLVVAEGYAEYRDNPAHRRAKLVMLTEQGRAAMKRIGPDHAKAARALARALGHVEFEAALQSLQRLSSGLDELAEQR